VIIGDLKRRESNGLTSIEATVVHEVPEPREQIIRYSVPLEFEEMLLPNFEAFVLPAAPVALFHGEERVKVEGKLCPELIDRLRAGLLLQKAWFGGDRPIPEITGLGPGHVPNQPRQTACFLSGGVDSLSLLGRNLQLYPVGHANRVTAGICVYGLDMGNPNMAPREDVFDEAITSLRQLEKPHSIRIIPCYTNTRDLEPDWRFYAQRHFGFALSGIAHSLSGGFSKVLAGLDNRADNHRPWGNHPLISKYASSEILQFETYLDGYTRLEKLEFLIDLQGALDVLRVCFTMGEIGSSQLNCGQCDKCVRTKLELSIYGVLESCSTFEDHSIPLERVRKFDTSKAMVEEYYTDLLPALKSQNRTELADALTFAIEQSSNKRSVTNDLQNLVMRAKRKVRRALR
jgi:hypothetical protein